MEILIFKIFYLIGYVVNFFIRNKFRNKKSKKTEGRKITLDKILLISAFVGINFIPLIYIFTPFLSFADYRLPLWVGVLGGFIWFFGIWLFYLSHRDLGANWSPKLEIQKDHQLISEGIYKYIRHPMYAAIWLMVIAQALLLQNFVAGLSGLVTFGFLYSTRISREESLMIKTFGDEYRDYSNRTGRLFPKNLLDLLVED